MKDDILSFKEKYLRLRERFDRVSATQRQHTTDLQTARLKVRQLKEENNHLLDLLSDIQHMNGSGPSSDSDTSMDDLSEFDDDDDDDELKGEGLGDQRQGRSTTKKMDTDVDRRTLTNKGRRDASFDRGAQLPQEYMDTAGASSSTIHNITNGSLLHHTINDRQASHSSGSSSSSSSSSGGNGGGGDGGGIGSSDASVPLVKPTPTVKKEKPEGAPKQTRRATKRADRGRPRAVVPLPTNSDGTLSYPIIVGKGTNEVIIENMGRIVWQGRGYHNHRYIFPVGFRSKKQYTSLSDTSKKTYFINEILDGGDQPVFQITLEDMPEKVFRHSSSSGAWELALKGLMELGYNAKTHASGPDMYGLTNLGVIKYIQEMPNAHRCRRYMPLKWIVMDDPTSPQPGDPAGSKSPGRKKKINNSLYASNHEILMETLEEESRLGSMAPSRPYTPRKYTKRKATATTSNATTGDPATEGGEEMHPSPSASPVLESSQDPGSEPMEDVKHEIEYPTLTPAKVMQGEALQSSNGQEPSFPNVPEMQVQERDGYQDKTSFHQYGPHFGQSLNEP